MTIEVHPVSAEARAPAADRHASPAHAGGEALADAGVPVYFGRGERPLFGWLHSPPPHGARGAVVLCPPLFVEELSAHRAFRVLAGRLAARGLLTLRLEYDGTGNSAGEEQEPGRVQAWLASIDAGRELLASLLPAAPLAVVGLRMGALLAAQACSGAAAPLPAMVLWDPCASGRDFVREQVALHALSIGAGDEPAHGAGAPGGAAAGGAPVEILGSLLSPDLVADLSSLELARIELAPAARLLAVVRSERRPRRAVTERLSAWGATVVAAAGQERLVDALPDAAAIPSETLDLIAEWLERSLAGGEAAVGGAALGAPGGAGGPRSAAEVAPGVEERVLRLGRLGLFGIESSPIGAPCGPTVAFLNAGLIHHVGPSRMWVSLSRRLAASGIPCVRLDLSGLGDSPVRPGQRRQVVYPPEALDDLAEVVEALAASSPNGVVLSGLCAGAYHSIEAGLSLPVRGVVPINPFLTFDPEEVREGGGLADGRGAVKPYRGWVRLLLRFRSLVDLGDRYSPPVLWWLLEKLGLHESPAAPIERLAERGVLVQLICGELESRQFTKRGGFTMRRLLRTGKVGLTVLPGTDHTLFGAAGRAQATDLVCNYVRQTYAGTRRRAAGGTAHHAPGAAPRQAGPVGLARGPGEAQDATAPTRASLSARWDGTTS